MLQNLQKHSQAELVKWGLESDTVTTNFNSTNENDIEAETEAIDDEVDFLQEVGYYRKEEEDEPSANQVDAHLFFIEKAAYRDLIVLQNINHHISINKIYC